MTTPYGNTFKEKAGNRLQQGGKGFANIAATYGGSVIGEKAGSYLDGPIGQLIDAVWQDNQQHSLDGNGFKP